MVVSKPYIRFKINNDPIENVLDYNHTWATTVETNKGPINTPILVNSASQAKNIFNVNVEPYFAQGAQSLIIVRVAAKSTNNDNEPTKGTFSFNTKGAINFAVAEQAVLKKTVDNVKYEHELYYVTLNNDTYKAVIKYKDADGHVVPDMFIDSWSDDGKIITEDIKEGSEVVTPKANIYDINKVKPLLVPKYYAIPAGSPLIRLESLYEGDYDITVSCGESLTMDEPGYYNIYITEPQFGTISIRNANDLSKIVSRINNANFNVIANLTDDGAIINGAMHSDAPAVDIANINIDGTNTSFIVSDILKDSFIALSRSKTDLSDIQVLTTTEQNNIAADIANANTPNYTAQATRDVLPYIINFTAAGSQLLTGGSNGEWDAIKGRIPTAYQAEAHRAGLKALQRIRLAGVFCMYGEEVIQREYVYHGIDPREPEKGMNNNETCKWRTILLGANKTDRTDITSLKQKAKSLNDQYTLFLGHGLIDTGMSGYASTLSTAHQRKLEVGIDNIHYLLPYECTQYIAGLRAKLDYSESIFGGQGRKRIRSIGKLDIAPLLSDEPTYEWNPSQTTALNESGVLTFTEEYGNITLTDGVTTVQRGSEEDEEGVMNILKYAENAIYDACLPFIGRNINADLENSINMAVESVLASMRDDDQSLVDTDEYSAYTVDISLGSRSNQLLGRIYIYLTITPVHALRQIEVEMTVQ